MLVMEYTSFIFFIALHILSFDSTPEIRKQLRVINRSRAIVSRYKLKGGIPDLCTGLSSRVAVRRWPKSICHLYINSKIPHRDLFICFPFYLHTATVGMPR